MQLMTKLETIIMNLTGCDRLAANLVANSIIQEIDDANRQEIYNQAQQNTAREILHLIMTQVEEIPGDVQTHKHSRIDELAILTISIVRKYLGGVR